MLIIQNKMMFKLIKKLTFLRLFNILKVYYGFFLSILFKSTYRFGYPISFSVEPSNICNLSCPECPVGSGTSHGGSTNLDFDIYKKIIDEVFPHSLSLIMYFQGEPFLNKRFLEMIYYANKYNLFTITSTNGHFLTKELANKIVKSGLNKLIISIDGSTQEIYEKYRVGGDLAKVIIGVKNVVEAKITNKSSHPFLVIQFLVNGKNEHQINNIKELAKSLKVDKLELKSSQIYNFEKGSDLIPSISKYSRYKKNTDGSFSIKSKLENRCKRLWESAVISSDGDVLPCCFDKLASYKMGNIKHNSFKEINNNKAYRNFRKSILIDRKSHEMCRNCTEGLRL